ncbi:hypothetical protein FLBR109950_14425 [Flavobacterium branchiophilum]
MECSFLLNFALETGVEILLEAPQPPKGVLYCTNIIC